MGRICEFIWFCVSMSVGVTCLYPHGLFPHGLSQRLPPSIRLHRRSPCRRLLPQSSRKKRACHREEECTRPPQRTSPHHPLPLQTSTHQTHQVISWGLKYLLGKYLAWLSDPTSQFKDTGLTNFSLYPANHQDIRRPRPIHTH